MKPTPEQVERAAGALIPFVQEWNLPLNPDALHEIAYAVLLHHDSDASWEEVHAEVRAQIAEVRAQHEAMLEAMRDAHPESE